MHVVPCDTFNIRYFIYRQNVFIIKTNTNDLSSSQDVLKAATVNANTVCGNLVNIADTKGNALKFNWNFIYLVNVTCIEDENCKEIFYRLGPKTFVDCNNDGQQIQWIKMQENSISVNPVSKQSALMLEKTQTANLNENQNNTSSQVNIIACDAFFSHT